MRRIGLLLVLVGLTSLFLEGCKEESAVAQGSSKFSKPQEYETEFPAVTESIEKLDVSPVLDTALASEVLRQDSIAKAQSASLDSVKDSLLSLKKTVVAPKVVRKGVDRDSVVPVQPPVEAVPPVDSLALSPVPADTTLCGETKSSEFCDPRDGKIYDLVVIGKQTWFRRNLDYEVEGSWCPNNQEKNCKIYGRLYQWNVANSCPEGWRLPRMTDFEDLYAYVRKSLSGQEGVGTSLKTIVGWNDDDDDATPGTNRFGFGAKPAGYRDDRGHFLSIGDEASFWTSQEVPGENRASYWNLYYANQDFIGSYVGLKTSAMSVRCIKGKSTK